MHRFMVGKPEETTWKTQA